MGCGIACKKLFGDVGERIRLRLKVCLFRNLNDTPWTFCFIFEYGPVLVMHS